ncbi:hypothetical protein OHB39_06260 [Streptomyces sp. NBC_00047]|uniref:hypothetical protein n=1 Tax=Streptomyces sp. NBC_00047 TaxID=2975627 RepID=UPI00224E4651|nr:hypothetical protein [Streptomyces sp. NBC_00047]MCX5607186.1 hypothetical protein [Streptomyces sp. NBC_00047]
MRPPRGREPRLCLACGTPVRRGKYRLCPAGCGARLHNDRMGPCGDAHAPVCPSRTPPPNGEEET